MASKSTKSEKSSEESSRITKSPNAVDHFRFCRKYMYGIKTSEIWKTPSMDRTKSTYFILPQEHINYLMINSYAMHRMIFPTMGDFEKFWFDELSDIHKDRYLLVNFMAVYNKEIRVSEVDGGPHAIEIGEFWIEKISFLAQSIRELLMEKNKNKFRQSGTLSIFLNGDGSRLVDILSAQYDCIFYAAIERMKTIEDPRMHPYYLETMTGKLNLVFLGFARTYFIWAAYDVENIRRYANELEYMMGEQVLKYLDGESRLTERIEFMRKLNLAAPRWSQSDRRMILNAIETDGKSCRGTYVQILLNEVGVERFKKLVFGKHRFCAHCHRSSYTGVDRLLACKRCDTEGVRPRAWYCDQQCQKADWRQHRASKHPTVVVVVEEKSGKKKKKRKPRKK